MGSIVFWGLIRSAILIPIIWWGKGYLDYTAWWTLSFLFIYGVVLHPAIIQYQHFREDNKHVLEGTLCSTCRHFDESAVLCTMYDEHPTEEYVPCEGTDWEPL